MIKHNKYVTLPLIGKNSEILPINGSVQIGLIREVDMCARVHADYQ